jgi:hypothetical protein
MMRLTRALPGACSLLLIRARALAQQTDERADTCDDKISAIKQEYLALGGDRSNIADGYTARKTA